MQSSKYYDGDDLAEKPAVALLSLLVLLSLHIGINDPIVFGNDAELFELFSLFCCFNVLKTGNTVFFLTPSDSLLVISCEVQVTPGSSEFSFKKGMPMIDKSENLLD